MLLRNTGKMFTYVVAMLQSHCYIDFETELLRNKYCAALGVKVAGKLTTK